MMPRFGFVALVSILGIAACSGPSAPSGPAEPPPPPPPAYPAYESFDPSGYDAEPRRRDDPIPHDVPDRLMEGRVDLPQEMEERVRTVDGFRIQIFSSEDRNMAESVLSEARAWWESQRGAPGASGDLQPEIAYVQPYYRVRIGAFEFRDDAQAMLSLVRRRYTDAFLVPDLVTIREQLRQPLSH